MILLDSTILNLINLVEYYNDIDLISSMYKNFQYQLHLLRGDFHRNDLSLSSVISLLDQISSFQLQSNPIQHYLFDIILTTFHSSLDTAMAKKIEKNELWAALNTFLWEVAANIL